MDDRSSFEKINYSLRINKQVERKIIIDIISQLKSKIDLSKYCYVGMGSVYYYDFIQMHRAFGIKKLTSIDNKQTIKRFEFNKPYDFIDFKNKFSTDYLNNHDWEIPSIIWLDYDCNFIGGEQESVISDLKIIGKNSAKNDIVFFSINAKQPKEPLEKKAFLSKFEKYISPKYNEISWCSKDKFPYLIQNIWMNILNESCEYNDNKFRKICSFIYQDGALMYTLGGIFDHTIELINPTPYEGIETDIDKIQNIEVPPITHKEKYNLDSKIEEIESQILNYKKDLRSKGHTDDKEINTLTEKYMQSKMDFELSLRDLENYIRNYRYIPMYFEGAL